MKILVFESYDGGSHRHVLDGLIHHSRHQFLRLGLPARKWKWRMRGSAITFSQAVPDFLQKQGIAADQIDLIFTSDMTSVADLKALLPVPLNTKPIVCYFHENQLTYPLEDESQRDYQYGFTNITSCLSATAVWFNSAYHRSSFLEGVERLLAKMPDHVPAGIAETILEKSQVLWPGIDDDVFITREGSTLHPPTVLWNQRWEYDKNPEDFFSMLFALQEQGVDFQLIVMGESFRTAPEIFEQAGVRLSPQVIHWGYAPSRASYIKLLSRSDIVVSTAIHEFYGISVLEAMAGGACPLLPDRLSYPEILPADWHDACLYPSIEKATERLRGWLSKGVPALSKSGQEMIAQRHWESSITSWDAALTEAATASC